MVISGRGQETVLQELHVGHPGMSEDWCCGQGSTWTLRTQFGHVLIAKRIRGHQLLLHSMHGSGQHIHGNISTLTMQVQCSEKCSSSWWTRTQKWLEVEIVPSATSANTIAKLWTMFATDALLQLIVSNIRTAFTSSEFQEFLTMNGFHHVKSALNHPMSNELTELYVQTFKSFMTSSGGDDLQQQLSQFLFQCHSTPHSATGLSPAQLLMGRRL